MSIIERIVQIMDLKHLNQTELCRILQITNSTFSTWKTRGTDPPAKYLILICNFLGVSVDYLLGRTDNPNTESNVTLSSDQNRLLQMYNLLSDMEKGEILGELKAMTANKRPIQTIRAVARSVDNRPPRLITGDFSDILDAPDISDKY